jgi:hypothetical protein
MAVIKDATNGKFKKIIDYIWKHENHRESFDVCLDSLSKLCDENPDNECFLFPTFNKNELCFKITKQNNPSETVKNGNIIFDKENGFSLSINS